jgi:hypothetical protein
MISLITNSLRKGARKTIPARAKLQVRLQDLQRTAEYIKNVQFRRRRCGGCAKIREQSSCAPIGPDADREWLKCHALRHGLCVFVDALKKKADHSIPHRHDTDVVISYQLDLGWQ